MPWFRCCFVAIIVSLANPVIAVKAAEGAAFFAALSSAAKAKVSPAVIASIKDGSPAEGFIVEYAYGHIRSRADRERLAFGLSHDDRSILKRNAVEFAAIKRRVLSAMEGKIMAAPRTFDYLPISHVKIIGMAALQDLVEDDGVVGVYLNDRYELNLAESLPLIGHSSIGVDGTGTTVAVLDTGVDYTNHAFGPCTSPGVPADVE